MSKQERKELGNFSSVVCMKALVQGVEDPRINVQSILTRHFLIEQLFGNRFAEVTEAELRFAVVMNWLGRIVTCLIFPSSTSTRVNASQ